MKIVLFIIALFCSIQTLASDTSLARYFPLKTGNAWFYKTEFSPIPFPPVFRKDFVQGDTIINNKKYFLFNSLYSIRLIRIDTTNGNLLQYSPANGCGSYPDDIIIDSLASNPGDEINCLFQSIFTRRCVSITNHNVFGIITEVKEFFHAGLIIQKIKYAKDFGVIYSCSGDPYCSGFTYLIGCKIDGVVYGDTILSDVKLISNIVPDEFSLAQNYPNPFNPKTVISYELRVTSFAKLMVYDVLGNEVAELVNEKQNAGTYSVEFDGSGFASGIYFYRLETNEFSDSKRMILIK
ncbi:MAG: T9SS type A sorting domain-containing protein [Ignavibacteria bacterium]